MTQGQATRSTFTCSRVIHFMIRYRHASEPPSASFARLRQAQLLTNDGLIDHHSRNRFAVLLLLWCVNAMCFRINGKAVNSVLDAEVFQLAVMLWVILMEN